MPDQRVFWLVLIPYAAAAICFCDAAVMLPTPRRGISTTAKQSAWKTPECIDCNTLCTVVFDERSAKKYDQKYCSVIDCGL